MSTEAPRPTGRWRSGLAWQGTEELAYATLLDALTRERLEDEARSIELNATSRRDMADVAEEQRRIDAELAEARVELETFRAALEDAHARGDSTGRGEVPYDSAIPEQNAYADVLIQYLVRPGYAQVRTEDREPGRYVYYLQIDWKRLRQLADQHGVRLLVLERP